VRFLPEYRVLSETPIGRKDALKLFKALGTPDGKFASPVIVRRYMSMPGMRAEELVQVEAPILHKYGYAPTSQSFAPVNALTTGAGMGYLSVTWVRQGSQHAEGPSGGAMTEQAASGTKVCPRCAEDVKQAALVCRYCRHEFVTD